MIEKVLYDLKNELKLSNYSNKTIKAYIACLDDYFAFIQPDIEILKEEKIKEFLLLKINKGLSPATVNLYLNAIKFYYYSFLKKQQKISVKFSKRNKSLPVVLSRNEILRMIESLSNQKHKLLIALSYGAGFRVSEAVNLKIRDIDLDQMTIHIKQAKGRKDRITVFPERLKEEIQTLISGRDENDFVFESERGGKITTRTAQKIFEKALRRSEIKKNATFHSMRHSFATHLLENGVDVRYVQELLGHQNIRTTQRYTQVTNPKLKNIKSPL